MKQRVGVIIINFKNKGGLMRIACYVIIGLALVKLAAIGAVAQRKWSGDMSDKVSIIAVSCVGLLAITLAVYALKYEVKEYERRKKLLKFYSKNKVDNP